MVCLPEHTAYLRPVGVDGAFAVAFEEGASVVLKVLRSDRQLRVGKFSRAAEVFGVEDFVDNLVGKPLQVTERQGNVVAA